MHDSGLTVDYDIWNEPDGPASDRTASTPPQYRQMWDSAVREMRRLDHTATIVGPSYSGYNHNLLNGFLDQAKADGTLPDVLNWHFGSDPVNHSADALALETAHRITSIPQTVNEYLFANQQTAGYTAWFLDASLTGNLVGTVSGNSAVAVARSADPHNRQVNALIGNNSGQTGTTTVTVDGLASAPWLTNGATVHARLERIPDQSPLQVPVTVTDQNATVQDGRISLPATFQSGTDAYWLTLSPDGTGSACLTGNPQRRAHDRRR